MYIIPYYMIIKQSLTSKEQRRCSHFSLSRVSPGLVASKSEKCLTQHQHAVLYKVLDLFFGY